VSPKDTVVVLDGVLSQLLDGQNRYEIAVPAPAKDTPQATEPKIRRILVFLDLVGVVLISSIT
jgi:hypothetical protein